MLNAVKYITSGKTIQKTLAILFLTAIFSMQLFSQDSKSVNSVCGTTEYMNMMKLQDPQYENYLMELEQRIKEYIKNNPMGPESMRTIPVVVHIVYKTSQQNIPDSQVVRQIEILNQCFSATNWDISKVPYRFAHLVANPQISFCLAKKDPKNKPTTGITRTLTTKDSFLVSNTDVKYTRKGGKDAWPSDKYFNIWVCNNEGWICYAQFPGGQSATDGVVMDYQMFGLSPNNPYWHNWGKILAHETGHWLNLRHIWGDDNGACTGTDYVDDTPNQSNWINGDHDSSEVIISCDNAPNGAMWMNFMDYTFGMSRWMFSLGQSARMDAVLVSDVNRKKIITSTVCNASNNPISGEIDESTFKLLTNYPNPFNPSTTIRFNIPVSGFTTLKIFDVTGKEVAELISGEINAGQHSVVFNAENFASGIYYYRLESAGNVDVKKMLLIK
jgi:hypothetical protein